MKSSCLLALLSPAALADPLGHFFRSVDETQPFTESQSYQLKPELAWLNNVSHYRLIPGQFPDGMEYHFDGLASVMKVSFTEGAATVTAKHFVSKASQDWDKCLFEGSGTSHKGLVPCMTNPVVNIVPLDQKGRGKGKLWLTIDERYWGEMDGNTLETLPGKAEIPWDTLNAHPACDRNTGECFVQHPCPAKSGVPLSPNVCVSTLAISEDGNVVTTVLSNQTLVGGGKLIQHDHSPCITPNYVVSKLDAFIPKTGKAQADPNATAGILKHLHQEMDNQWMVMDRETNVSRIMQGGIRFAMDHTLNCFENAQGEVVVDFVAVTEHYLDTYFYNNTPSGAGSTTWSKIFAPAQRCLMPTAGDLVTCAPFMEGSDAVEAGGLPFDYPTFNPLFKMNPKYQWVYAVQPTAVDAPWFDKIVKISSGNDGSSRSVVKSWSAPGVQVSEADFIPRPGGTEEDDGVIVSVLYNTATDKSSVGVFDPKTMEKLDEVPLTQVIPFHAHGISCVSDECYTNP